MTLCNKIWEISEGISYLGRDYEEALYPVPCFLSVVVMPNTAHDGNWSSRVPERTLWWELPLTWDWLVVTAFKLGRLLATLSNLTERAVFQVFKEVCLNCLFPRLDNSNAFNIFMIDILSKLIMFPTLVAIWSLDCQKFLDSLHPTHLKFSFFGFLMLIYRPRSSLVYFICEHIYIE